MIDELERLYVSQNRGYGCIGRGLDLDAVSMVNGPSCDEIVIIGKKRPESVLVQAIFLEVGKDLACKRNVPLGQSGQPSEDRFENMFVQESIFEVVIPDD